MNTFIYHKGNYSLYIAQGECGKLLIDTAIGSHAITEEIDRAGVDALRNYLDDLEMGV